RPGFLFVALESETVDSTQFGTRIDGRLHIAKAVENGAVAILTDLETVIPSDIDQAIPIIRCDEPRFGLGIVAANFYKNLQPETIALVTGTNGKTSVVHFTTAIWEHLGTKSASIGTLGVKDGFGNLIRDADSGLSVPETVALHAVLSELYLQGRNAISMEATSHALFDFRLSSVNATIAAFTNFTRDHLDFHADMEEYFQIKLRLFKDVVPEGCFAVLNTDMDRYLDVFNVCKARRLKTLTYGKDSDDFKMLSTSQTSYDQTLSFSFDNQNYTVTIPLVGEFQAYNFLCAVAIVHCSGVPLPAILDAASKLKPVEGRMSLVAELTNGSKIFIDYAHTPDGLRAALEATKAITRNRVLLVISCLGDRDKGKRSEMGEVASRLSDCTFVCDGDPGSELPQVIRAAIISKCTTAIEEPDRKIAIQRAIRGLKDDDSLLIVGRGDVRYHLAGSSHETTDRELVLGILSEESIHL
ncbi:MAG: UDP-N-acetylmuramoyl-L-alanyl-D-glutamate--2,6-diaminopimelate ligase, partial [Bdellovibrionales bacterium]|nr:UDP-N-acetylmuramoyl-L-alanyl-D-glutamate--2,6-diaminopimelate ligase [Bdellovibrionales bacterium]